MSAFHPKRTLDSYKSGRWRGRACSRAIAMAVARLPRSGRLAQLVEHLVYTERVGGSSPSAPTTNNSLKR